MPTRTRLLTRCSRSGNRSFSPSIGSIPASAPPTCARCAASSIRRCRPSSARSLARVGARSRNSMLFGWCATWKAPGSTAGGSRTTASPTTWCGSGRQGRRVAAGRAQNVLPVRQRAPARRLLLRPPALVDVTCDVASAAFVGWRVSLQPNAAVVCHSVLNAIQRFGLPEHWLRDNGKEFTAKRLGGKPLRGSLADPAPADLGDAERWPALAPDDVVNSTVWQHLGVQLHTAIPYSSGRKLVEIFVRGLEPARGKSAARLHGP